MSWQITIDASTLGMVGATLMSAGTAVWYVSRAAAKIDSIEKLEALVSSLRSDRERDRADWKVAISKIATMWHRFGFSDREIKEVREEVAGERPRTVLPFNYRAVEAEPLEPPHHSSAPRALSQWKTPIPRTDEDDARDTVPPKRPRR